MNKKPKNKKLTNNNETKGPQGIDYQDSINEKPLIVRIEEHLLKNNDYRFNEVTGYVEFKCKTCNEIQILDDYEVNTLYRGLAHKKLTMAIGSLKSLLKSNFIPKYNPFKTYFNEKLPIWDGETDYIQLLANTVHTTDDNYWSNTFRKWIVALVAALLEDDKVNQTVIIFTGKQGLGKTTWLISLVPNYLKKYVYSGNINPTDKDTLIYLSTCMLIILDELENLNIKQLGSTKELITKSVIQIRRPYGSIYETITRRASFAGSVNNHEFLSDITGSRRFLPFEALSINYNHGISMDHVYAQAYALYRSGFRYWFDEEEIDVINRINDNYRIKTIEEELLLKYFEPCKESKDVELLSATEIMKEIFEDNKITNTNASMQRLGKILKSLKFKNVKRNGRQLYILKRKASINYIYTAESPEKSKN